MYVRKLFCISPLLLRCQNLPPCGTNHLSTASTFKPLMPRKLEAPNLHYANSTWKVFQLASVWP